MRTLLKTPLHRLWFYLLILLMPTQLGFHAWPDWSLVLGRRVDYLSPTLFITDVLIFMTIASYCVAYVRNHKQRALIHLSRIDVRLFGIIGIFCFVNIITALEPNAAFFGWIKILEYVLLFVYIRRAKPQVHTLFLLLSIAVLFSAGLGIAQILHGGSMGGIFWWLGERTFTLSTPNIAKGVVCLPQTLSCIEYLRPYATFPHPNVFGGFLAFYIILLIQYPFKATFSHSLLFKSFLLITSATTLLFTFSRSAWVAVACTSLLLLVNRHVYFRQFMRRYGVGAVVAIIVFLSLSPLPFQGMEFIDVRISLNQAALKIIQEYPITGVGLKNFLITLPDFLPSRTIYFLQPVHNIYLLLVSEFGIGSILLCYILWKRYVSNISRPAYATILLFLLIGLFDHYPITLQQGQLLFVLSLSRAFLFEHSASDT